MKYKYTGYDATARKVEGELEAQDEREVRSMLRGQAIRPVKIQAKQIVAMGGFKFDMSFLSSGSPSMVEFTAFIRQLATMQAAGIPIVQSISVLGDQVENKRFGEVLKRVQKDITEGMNLTEALRRHPKVFDKIFLNLIAAGEMSGALEKVLLRLATYYEKANSLRRKIKGAMTYPILIVVMVFGLVTVMMLFVVPTFASLFSASGKALPGPTQVVLDISNFFKAYWYLIFSAAGGVVYGVMHTWKNEKARKYLDPYMMKLPIFGDLIKKIAIARFSRTLATMIQSGVPILDALDITSKVAGNYAVEAAVERTRQSISEGNSIAGPLQSAGIFPQMAVSMIAIGEQSGALEQMLTKIAEFYEDEVDARVSSITSILEPLMIVIVGGVVAGVLIPMYLPVFKLGDTIGGD